MKVKSGKIELVFSIAVIVLLSVLTLIFAYLYIKVGGGFLYNHQTACFAISVAVISVLTAIAILFQIYDKSFVYRLCMLTLLTSSVVLIILYFLKISGFWEKVDSAQEIREFIASTGSFAVIVFIILQILQVIILPVPGVLMIGAGSMLFGPLKGSVFSFIGIMIGSLIGFFVGRVLGYKAARWLVGDGIDKVLKNVKGKDKIVLSFMFLFPFFPDDILCFVSGMSSMSTKFFLITVSLARIISVFFTAFSVSGNLIPYNTWWGIMLWCIIFVLTIILGIFIYKNGEKIERKFVKKFHSKAK